MSDKKINGTNSRSLSLVAQEARVLDEVNRTIRFPFSSEAPVERWFGKEILSHEPGCVRIGQRQKSMPLLFNHKMDDLIGVVESIELCNDKRQYCTIRFGRDERGEWAFQQAKDGILSNASFLYRVFKFIEDVETETYTAIDWEPYEVSLVTVPADASVGIGRSATEESPQAEIITRNHQPAVAEKKEQTMPEVKDKPTDGAPAGVATIDVNQIAERERQRIIEIDAMCRQHNIATDVRDGMIKNGATIEQARGTVLDQLQTRTAEPAVSAGRGFAPDLSEREKASYSMIRAINAVINKDWKNAGFEREVSNEISKRMSKTTEGFFMPTNIPFAERAQYAADAPATGGVMVATNLLSGNFIDILRKKARLMQLGATVLSGLVGNVAIPRQKGSSSVFWIGEKGTLTESEATFELVTLAMRTAGTYSAITRNMLMQSTPDVEMLARADLIASLALGIDLAGLSGPGGDAPLGIANQAGVQTVIGGANGALLTIDHLIDMETAIATKDADVDGMAYLANAQTVGRLKKIVSQTGQYLWTNAPFGQRSGTPGEINGYPVARSNQARSNLTKGTSSGLCSEAFFGNWADVLIGEWGSVEIMPNPYDPTMYKQGGVLLRILQSVDVAIRHPESFCTMSDALTK